MTNENNNNTDNQKDGIMDNNQKKIVESDILKEKEKLFGDSDISPEVKSVLDDVFSDMIEDDGSENNFTESEKTDMYDSDIEVEGIMVEPLGSTDDKIQELNEKINDYNELYDKLKEKEKEFESRNHSLIEKKKVYEEMVIQLEEKTLQLDDSKKEFLMKNEKLDDAREQFKNLSKSVEEKKFDIEKLELKLKKTEKIIERNKNEFEKKIFEFEREKLEFETERSEPISISKGSEIQDRLRQKQFDEVSIPTVELHETKGRIEILQDLLQELSYQGDFKSCFLIDGKGLIISEYSNTKLNPVAIGAMFSLVYTSLLRAIKALNLTELEHFKLSSGNGEFLLKNLSISNYNRPFILLAYYDESNSHLPNLSGKISKKLIRKIMKSIKGDFKENQEESKISLMFDNLIEKVNFLKQKYNKTEENSEIIRIEYLNKTAMKIKDLFEL